MNNSKKVLRLTVSYAELFNRCPPEQARNLKILQDKHKQYKDRLYELPEEPPKIDWEYYKQKVRPEYVSMVEEFEKKYNELKVPYPEDPYSAQIEDIKKAVEAEVLAYKAESDQRIRELEDEIVMKCCQIPVEEMTMEEFCECCPELAPDFINRPTFWPHTPEDQIPGLLEQEQIKPSDKEDKSDKSEKIEEKKYEKSQKKHAEKNVEKSVKEIESKLKSKDKSQSPKSKEEISKNPKNPEDKPKPT